MFADVDEYLCLDPQSVAERITDRTRAIMFVGLGGNTGQLAQIADFAHQRGLKLVLDAAHMAGTRLQGRHVAPRPMLSSLATRRSKICRPRTLA